MKLLILSICLAMLAAACETAADREEPLHREYLGYGVSKIHDGPVTCYVLYTHGISCLKEQ